MSAKAKKTVNMLVSLLGFALLLLAAFLALNCASLYIWPKYGRFGDAEIARFYGTVVCAILVPLSVAAGLILVVRKSGSKKLVLPTWIITGVTAAAMLVPLSCIVYSMRPVPNYDPQNYQHLVGQHLRDARSQLDTKHSVSGFGGRDGAACSFLSLRGMEIVADRDGIIIEVKKGRRD